MGAPRLGLGRDGDRSRPATLYAKATFTFQAPVDATAVSAGFYVDTASTNHTYTIDDTSLVDADARRSAAGAHVVPAGTGSGTVTSSPAGIACGAICQATFNSGATVTLTAAATAGSSFTGWSGACAGSATTCAVTMSAAKSATAMFTLLPVQLSVVQAGTGSGGVTSSPAGVDCGATCQASFANGSSVTLTAAAAADSTSRAGAAPAAAAHRRARRDDGTKSRHVGEPEAGTRHDHLGAGAAHDEEDDVVAQVAPTAKRIQIVANGRHERCGRVAPA